MTKTRVTGLVKTVLERETYTQGPKTLPFLVSYPAYSVFTQNSILQRHIMIF